MTSRKFKPLLFLATLLAVLACDEKTTPIQTLLNDPQRYDGKTVRVAGEVQQALGALGFGAYQIKDQTGTLPVISEGGGAPATGTQVAVEGTFRAAYTLGNQSAAVLVERRRVTR